MVYFDKYSSLIFIDVPAYSSALKIYDLCNMIKEQGHRFLDHFPYLFQHSNKNINEVYFELSLMSVVRYVLNKTDEEEKNNRKKQSRID